MVSINLINLINSAMIDIFSFSENFSTWWDQHDTIETDNFAWKNSKWTTYSRLLNILNFLGVSFKTAITEGKRSKNLLKKQANIYLG